MADTVRQVSARLIMIAMALLLILLGTDFFESEFTKISKALVLIGAAVVLALEIGIRRLLDIGKSKDSILYFGIALIVLLTLLGIFSMVGMVSAAPWFATTQNVVVVLGAFWLLIEAFV